MTRGRPSKVVTYNLSNEVDVLRGKGLSNKDIATELMKLHPECNISQSSIGRYFRREGNIASLTPSDSVFKLNEIFRGIYFHLDKLESLSQPDRRAILKYIRTEEKAIEGMLRTQHRNLVKNPETENTKELLSHFSRLLCNTCRQSVVREVLILEEKRRISDSIST